MKLIAALTLLTAGLGWTVDPLTGWLALVAVLLAGNLYLSWKV